MRPLWIWRLYRSELVKCSRQRFTLVSLVLLALIGVILSLTFEGALSSEYLTGFEVLIHVAQSVIGLFFNFLVIIFCSMLVAGETSGGTFRMVLSRPVTRAEFLTAKVMMGLTFIVLALAWYMLVAVLAIRFGTAYEFGPVIEDGELVISSAAISWNITLALLLALLPLMASAAYGILMSVIARSLSTAIGVALGVLVAVDLVKHIIHLGDHDLADYVFSTHLGKALHVANKFASGNEPVWFDPDPELMAMLVPGVSIMLFLAAAYVIFMRRDFNE